jgi:hypothetical protein
MSMHLTVVNPFKKYVRGALISDAAEVAEILQSEYRQNVVQRIPHPEHVSGDFHRTDDEIAARKDKLSAAAPVKLGPIVTRADTQA